MSKVVSFSCNFLWTFVQAFFCHINIQIVFTYDFINYHAYVHNVCGMGECIFVGVRGQPCGVVSALHFYMGSTDWAQVRFWQQVLLSIESSCWPSVLLIQFMSVACTYLIRQLHAAYANKWKIFGSMYQVIYNCTEVTLRVMGVFFIMQVLPAVIEWLLG